MLKKQGKTDILYQNLVYDKNHPTIEVICFGNRFDSATIKNFQKQLKDYNLADAKLLIHQDANALDINDLATIRSSIMEDITKSKEQQTQQLALMQEVMKQNKTSELNDEIVKELHALDTNLIRVSLHNSVFYNYDSSRYDTIPLLIYETKEKRKSSENETPSWYQWMKQRIKADTLNVIEEPKVDK